MKLKRLIIAILSVTYTLTALPAADENMPPIIEATMDDNQTEINRLLRDGAKINDQDAQGLTALHWAASLNNENMVKFLLRKGINTSIRSDNGFTAESYARALKNNTIADIIKKHDEKNKGMVERSADYARGVVDWAAGFIPGSKAPQAEAIPHTTRTADEGFEEIIITK